MNAQEWFEEEEDSGLTNTSSAIIDVGNQKTLHASCQTRHRNLSRGLDIMLSADSCFDGTGRLNFIVRTLRRCLLEMALWRERSEVVDVIAAQKMR
jgi:hypothetical protein